jgi:hypothetical protein
MLRLVYLGTLVILQLALVVKVAPPLAQALRVDALAGLAPEGWPALLQLLATGLAVAGAALALVFPGVALARHRRAGTQRFLGLPRWAMGLALAGIALLAVGTLGLALSPIMPVEARSIASLVARPAGTGGLALATAGVLCAELLRRSVPVARAARPRPHSTHGRIEVTYPPELRTCALGNGGHEMQA